MWCTVIDREHGQPPAVVKQVFSAFPPGAAAGPGRFRGQAAMGAHSACWDVAITGGQPLLRPLRPPVLYRAPLPRTKLEATVLRPTPGHQRSRTGLAGIRAATCDGNGCYPCDR